MEHTYFKNHYVICTFCGDELNLMELINEFCEKFKAEYYNWIEPEDDDEWYRCDFVDSDCGDSFKKWLKENYPDAKIMEKIS